MTALFALVFAAAAAAQENSLIGSSVSSDKWNIKRGDQKVEEFTGNVQYRKEGRRLAADWALYNHDTQRLEARGSLSAEDRLGDGTTATARGEKAFFERLSGKGWLTGKRPEDEVSLLVQRPDGSEQGRGGARRAEWDVKRREVLLQGDAWFKEERGDVQADTARFIHPAKTMELAGRRPVIRAVGPGWSAAVQADALTATAIDDDRRRVSGKGGAKGWLHFPSDSPLGP
ncbi:MAG: hypothetical protein HY928_14155 [Elusimicrobia bacterium]|nr:hypothetical protein [Elusimicrobiota bacterium]